MISADIAEKGVYINSTAVLYYMRAPWTRSLHIIVGSGFFFVPKEVGAPAIKLYVRKSR